MFKQALSQTPFTNEVADGCFPNIVGDDYCGDTTFVATLRALMAHRMGEDDRICLKLTSSYNVASELPSSNANAVRAVFRDDDYADGTAIIHSFEASEEDNKAWMDKMKSGFTKVNKDWTMITKVTQFFANQFYVLCFINVEHKKVVIMIDQIDMQAYHFIQLLIPIAFPWYFEGENEFQKNGIEYELIESFNNKSSENYLKVMEKLAEPYDFRAMKIKQLLAGFEARQERAELIRLEQRIERLIRDIQNYNDEIAHRLADKRDYETRLLGIKHKIAEDGETSEIMNYFLCNRNLRLNRINDNGDMYFTVEAYVENYDEDMAQTMLDNNRSYIYRPTDRNCNEYIKAADIKLLMKAIFIEQSVRLKFCATYRFNISGNVSGMSYSNETYVSECNNCMPNPHIDYHSCMGGYQRVINEMLVTNDYIGAITQCIASCQSLNFGDYTVMRDFMRNIYGFPGHTVNNRCIELPDGSVATPKDAIAWLKKQQSNTTEPEVTEGEEGEETDE